MTNIQIGFLGRVFASTQLLSCFLNKMKCWRVLVALGTATIVSFPIFAGERDLIGMQYREARPQLIAMGFRTVHLKHNKDDLFCRRGFCERYPEVVDCSGSGLAPCMFAFFRKSNGQYYVVATTGETLLRVTDVRIAGGFELGDIRERQPENGVRAKAE